MATSTFFNNYGASNEQGLMEDLIVESINIHGLDFYYLPRTINNLDPVYLQDAVSTYTQAIQIPMYVTNPEGFSGQGTILKQFGIEVRDQINFSVARRTFQIDITTNTEITRPREGDLLYYPLNNKVFLIKFVEDKPVHYPLGVLPTYELYCELFEYSNEQFDTGIPEIDRIQTELSTNIYDFGILDETGKAIADELGRVIVNSNYDFDILDPIENNTEFSEEAQDLIDFTEENPFGEIE